MSKELATGQKAGEAIKAGTDAAAIAAISVLIGFPLPPTLAMNIITALGTLVTSSLDVPTAYLQALATRMRAEGAAKAEVVTKTAKIAVKTIGEDDELAERATLYLGGRMLREQTNREEVVAVAVNQLRAEPAPDGDAPAHVDADWLDMFARHAETKSSDEMRAYFGRVLAGELRKPGSFSPATVEVLSRLTKESARLFQQFCNITGVFGGGGDPVLLVEPYGIEAAGSNKLGPLGFHYSTLMELAEAGLLRSDLSAARIVAPIAFTLAPSIIAGRSIELRLTEGMSEDAEARLKTRQDLAAVFFTQAGKELRRIVHMTPNEAYLAQFLEWARGQGMVPVDAP